MFGYNRVQVGGSVFYPCVLVAYCQQLAQHNRQDRGRERIIRPLARELVRKIERFANLGQY